MTSKQDKEGTVTVNGQQYDAHTGLPVTNEASHTPTSHRNQATTSSIHKKAPQKSQTLSRTGVTKPGASHKRSSVDGMAPRRTRLAHAAAAHHSVPATSSRPAAQSVVRHPSVQKFAAQQQPEASKASGDIGPVVHPHAVQAQSKLAQKAVASAAPIKKQKSAAQLKQEAIAKAMAAPAPEPTPTEHPLMKRRSKHLFFASVGMLSIVAVAAATWTYMPNLSVQLASAQSGIAASYPEFRPDGYSLVLPVDHSPDEVTMTFKENGGSSQFNLTQSKSSWDSSAVREKVAKDSKGQFLTTQDRGLTIYTYNGNAAWVNKGILYQITGDSRLSSDHILKIASSL